MRNRAGRQAELARISGLLPGTLSNMANHPTHGINLEAAMILEVATSGELPAEALCPSGAKLLERFFLTRAAKVAG
jgi:DNA-binding transcriptional regulator YdaS (Cro superfamily)